MKKIVRTTGLLLLSSVLCSPAFADGNSDLIANGAIRGRIVDSEKQVLPGASIFIENLKSGVVSDENGFYTLSNLKPGTYTVKVTYVGYEPITMTLTVPEGKTVEKNIILNEGLSLHEVVVGGVFQGQSRAINSQKNKIGIVNVVSADQVGKFPDSNIGDALKRISGINVQYDQGEARFGQVRGTSADLSSVTINGDRLPSAEGDVRNVQLDLIPSDMIQTIEVNKVVTSDMDGDAIGGSINLITKNTPYKRTFNATLGTGYNWISEDPQLNFGLTYGDRFFNDKLGIMAAISYQNAPSGSDNTEFEYTMDDDDNVVLSSAETRQYYVTRQRQSYSLSLDYNINPNHKLFFKGIYNRRHDWENRYAIAFKDIEEGEGGMKAEIETKGGTGDNRNARLELQQTMDYAVGGEHLLGKLNIDWGASFARASEDRPNERYFGVKLKDQTFEVVDAGGRHPYVSTPVNIAEGNWKMDALTNANEDIVEKDMKFHLNFELPLAKGEFSNTLKFGGKYVHKDKSKESHEIDYTDAYSGTEYLNHLSTEIRDGFMAGDQYKPQDFVSKEYLGSFNFKNMEGVENLEEAAGNYDASEAVTSAFLRFDQNLGKHHQLVLGLRMEATNLEYQGWNLNVDEDENMTLEQTGKEKNNYVNWLPSVLYKWNVNDDFKVRASFTETLARPKYSDLVPSTNINLHDKEIFIGNSEMTPTLSYNFDLSADYYFQSVGLVSAGLFYKNIKDFIVEQRTSGMYDGREYDVIKTPKNAGDAELLGVELAYQRDFGFITPALKAFGFYGNYTYTHSKVNHFNFEGRENEKDLPMPGSPEHTANASLFYEKNGVNVRLSYNYASSFIDEMGEHAELDRYYDSVNYLDLNASYTFGKKVKCTFYAEANNLLNQPLRYYQGTKDRTMQVEYYGVKVNAGVKVCF